MGTVKHRAPALSAAKHSAPALAPRYRWVERKGLWVRHLVPFPLLAYAHFPLYLKPQATERL